jgi:cell division protein ZapA (FtsZ GTPase activity inhibitor)
MGGEKKKISVKVPVAGRIYPLSIYMDEEEALRKAATEINDSIQKMRATYAVRDVQDLLAMTALEAVTRLKKAGLSEEMDELKDALETLNQDLIDLSE